MFAVIKTGGKQYRVAPNDVVVVEKLPTDAGDTHVFGDVLMLGDGSSVEMGAPLIGGAQVVGEVLEQRRGAKITIYKTRQRNTYMRKKGHRQLETVIRITEILAKGGKTLSAQKAEPGAERPALRRSDADKPAAKPQKKVEAKAVAKPAPKAEAKAEKPAAKAAPKADGGGDDLTKLTGVGKVMGGKLNEAGITAYAEVAALSADKFAELDAEIFKGRVPHDQLVAEAKDLAK